MTSSPARGRARDEQRDAWRGPDGRRVAWRPRLWRELAFGLALFGCYAVVAAFDSRRSAFAEANGRAIYDLQRRLSIDIEDTLNRWLADQNLVRTIANYEYAITYVLVALVLLVWLYLRRPATYRWARTSFALINIVGISCFALYPVMPPRLMPGLGFIDTVSLGHTWGSWGSPLVSSANQFAAMPSLHVAWAMWVTVVLALIRANRLVQFLSVLHVASTTFVIMATANHYLLDAVAGAVVVIGCVAITAPARRGDTARGSRVALPPRVPAADAFFLYVETPAAAQHVGGVVMLDTTGLPDGEPSARRLAADIRANIDLLPRFRQRLSRPSRWRRPRWVDCAEVDWDWHVPAYDLTGPDGRPGGEQALYALLDELAATPLPPDRPMWRFALIDGFAPGRMCAVLLMHHVIADGTGAVLHALKFIKPAYTMPAPKTRQPGRLRTAAAIAVGLAQLATDGRPAGTLPSSGTSHRRVALVDFPLDDVRDTARKLGVRVTDIVLSAVAGGLRRAVPDPGRLPPKLRVSVTLMLRPPGSGAEGNATGAVIMDLPLGPVPELERLASIAARSNRLRTGTRALASRFVMKTVGDLLPAPVFAWFARTVYGGRFFHAVVSNMPAPDIQLYLAGAPMREVYPLLPLAPGAPLTAGALGWNGLLCLGIEVDPVLVADRDTLGKAVAAVFAELRGTVTPDTGPAPDTVPTSDSVPTPGTAASSAGL